MSTRNFILWKRVFSWNKCDSREATLSQNTLTAGGGMDFLPSYPPLEQMNVVLYKNPISSSSSPSSSSMCFSTLWPVGPTFKRVGGHASANGLWQTGHTVSFKSFKQKLVLQDLFFSPSLPCEEGPLCVSCAALKTWKNYAFPWWTVCISCTCVRQQMALLDSGQWAPKEGAVKKVHNTHLYEWCLQRATKYCGPQRFEIPILHTVNR